MTPELYPFVVLDKTVDEIRKVLIADNASPKGHAGLDKIKATILADMKGEDRSRSLYRLKQMYANGYSVDQGVLIFTHVVESGIIALSDSTS